MLFLIIACFHTLNYYYNRENESKVHSTLVKLTGINSLRAGLLPVNRPLFYTLVGVPTELLHCSQGGDKFLLGTVLELDALVLGLAELVVRCVGCGGTQTARQ